MSLTFTCSWLSLRFTHHNQGNSSKSSIQVLHIRSQLSTSKLLENLNMSGQNYYQLGLGSNGEPTQNNNPYQQSQQAQNAWDQQPGNAPPGLQQPTSQGQSQQHSYSQQGYSAPPGPPPGQAPRRTGTFEGTAFVPPDEQGEQREALEQFELNKGQQSQEDRDMETLQREFPGIDGSLIAALYGDSKSLSGTREMLTELGGQS